MKKLFVLLLAIISLAPMSLTAQEAYKDGFLSHFGVAAKIGTYGPGIDIHTSLLPNLKARVGFNYLSYGYNDAIDFTANDATDPSKEVNGQITNAKLKFPNANILVDFYPVKSGIFCLTAGAYIGNNNVHAEGTADGEFDFDDVIIKPKNGKFDADLKMGGVFKPYFGIGLGRTISKSRVGFRFDLGMIYQGDYTVESDYSDNAIKVKDKESADFDLPFSKNLLNLWPMLSFSLSYRIN